MPMLMKYVGIIILIYLQIEGKWFTDRSDFFYRP
jgi:hypothetical protein